MIVKLFNSHSAVENVNDLFVVNPSENERLTIPAVDSLKLLSYIIKGLVVLHSDFEFEILVSIIDSIFHHVAVNIYPIDLNNGHTYHEVRLKGDRDAIALRARQLRFVLTMEKI